MKSIKKDPYNSLAEEFKKENIDYWYEQALKHNSSMFNAILAVKTMSATDLEIILLKIRGVI